MALGAESAMQEPGWDPGVAWDSDQAQTGHFSPLSASCPEDTWCGPRDLYQRRDKVIHSWLHPYQSFQEMLPSASMVLTLSSDPPC